VGRDAPSGTQDIPLIYWNLERAGLEARIRGGVGLLAVQRNRGTRVFHLDTEDDVIVWSCGFGGSSFVRVLRDGNKDVSRTPNAQVSA
jgi:hypothetical protein